MKDLRFNPEFLINIPLTYYYLGADVAEVINKRKEIEKTLDPKYDYYFSVWSGDDENYDPICLLQVSRYETEEERRERILEVRDKHIKADEAASRSWERQKHKVKQAQLRKLNKVDKRKE